MIVRSAAKPVSKTRSKPRRRSAAVIAPSTSVPGGRPNSSPRVTETAGACCTTTNFSGSCRASSTSLIVALLGQGAGGADGDALAAVDAARYVQALVEGGADLRVDAAADEVDGRHALDLLAHAHALAAEDALGRIADDRRAGDVECSGGASRRRSAAGARPTRRPASAARSCRCGAVQAVVGMVGQQQLDDRLAGVGPRAASASGPSCRRRTGKAQLGTRPRCPSTSTTHIRQAPLGGQPVDVAQRGTLIARPPQRRRAASRPFRPGSSCPLTSIGDHRCAPPSIATTARRRRSGRRPRNCRSRCTFDDDVVRASSRADDRLGRALLRAQRAARALRRCRSSR